MDGQLLLRIVAAPKTRDKVERPGAGSGGFTLIEVVLALTIFALMGAILYGAYSLAYSAVEKSQVNSTRNQKQRSIADLLGSYVRSTFAYRESAEEQTIFFEGDSESFTFVSAYSQSMGGRGMAKIQVTANEDENGRATLRLDETVPVRFNSEVAAPGETQSLILQENIKEFRLAYLDPQAEDESWEDRWDGKERRILPRAVRFTYRDERGQEVRWIFPIMLTVLAP